MAKKLGSQEKYIALSYGRIPFNKYIKNDGKRSHRLPNTTVIVDRNKNH
jgi:hypothetical protein